MVEEYALLQGSKTFRFIVIKQREMEGWTKPIVVIIIWGLSRWSSSQLVSLFIHLLLTVWKKEDDVDGSIEYKVLIIQISKTNF